MMNRDEHERAPEDRAPACGVGEHAGSVGETAFSGASFERASRMLRAAGDVARLGLLEMLSRDEMCVTEIAATTGEGLSTVSQRLGMLRREGLIVGRREGKHVYYALSDGHVAELILSVLDHAAELEGAPVSKTPRDSREPTREGERDMTEKLHEGHEHVHGEGCGHTAVSHDGHTDYLHDGHLHHQEENGAVEEHVISVSDANPDAHNNHEAEHAADHEHGTGCGHEAVPHGDHTDYLVEGHLHRPHGDHCDNHGPVEVVSA